MSKTVFEWLKGHFPAATPLGDVFAVFGRLGYVARKELPLPAEFMPINEWPPIPSETIQKRWLHNDSVSVIRFDEVGVFVSCFNSELHIPYSFFKSFYIKNCQFNNPNGNTCP